MRPALPDRPAATILLALALLSGVLAEASQVPRFDHLRPVDDLADEFLRDAWLGSETVRRLAETLEASDVFVQIETRLQENNRGRLRLMSGSSVCRWVRVTVRIPGRRPALLAVLAHELQHAVEIARAPDARNIESVEALFQRIGFRRDGPQFETEAALAIEEQVRRELARNGGVR